MRTLEAYLRGIAVMKLRGKKKTFKLKKGFLLLVKALSVLLAALVLVGGRGSLAGGVGAAVTPSHHAVWGHWGQRVAVGLTVPDVGSQCGLERGRKGGLCPWQLLPALPWQHICFLHFSIPAKGEPQPFWCQHKPRKNPSPNKTPFHWSLSPQAAALSSMTVKAFTLSWTEHSLTKRVCLAAAALFLKKHCNP